MITEVLLRNFKCFKSLTIPVLGRITLIGGRNNVGKTALLEALFLFLDRMRPDMVLRQYAWRGIEGVLTEPRTMWAPLFHNHDMEQDIFISATLDGETENAQYRFDPNFAPPATRRSPQPMEREIPTDQEPATSFALDIKYTDKDNRPKQLSSLSIDGQGRPYLHVEYAAGKPPSAGFLAAKKHVSSRDTTNMFSSFVKEGRENEVVQFLQIIEPRLEALTVVTEGPGSFVHGKLRGVSRTREVHLMGEGMEKLLNIILHIGSAQGGCVFVDEMENGLHYSGLPRIWEAISKALRAYNCQFITTTHSYECVRSACEGLSQMPEDFKYIRLERKAGDIHAHLSNYEMIATAIKTGLEMR